MANTDTANAKLYASQAQVAAAQAKLYAQSGEAATDAAQQAIAAASTAEMASSSASSSAESSASQALSSASSASSAALSAEQASNTLLSAVKQQITFITGGTLYSPLDRISDGTYLYYWTGSFPKVVPALSSVTGTGGIGAGYWACDTDILLRQSMLSEVEGQGASLSAMEQGGTVQDAIWYRTVESFGAKGDGVTDDHNAFQMGLDWLCSGPYRELKSSSGKLYRIGSPLVATFSGQSTIFCHLNLQGPIYPDAGVGDALTIREATYCYFTLKVKGDGYNITGMPDYSLPDPVGCQQAFVINSCRACKVDVCGYGYAGRVIRTKGTGVIKMSFIELSIKTGEGSCGQSAYLQATSDAFGCICHAQTQWDYYGAVLDTLTDVTINYWEYGNKNSAVPAMLLNNCGSVSIANMAGGSTWDSDTSTTIKIINGQGIHASRLQVGEAYTGLYIEGDGTIGDKPTVTVDYLISYKTNSAVVLNNTTGIRIKSGLCDNTYYGVKYIGNIYNCRVDFDGRNNFTAMHFADTGVNIDSLSIGGGMYSEVAAHFVSMVNATVGKLMLSDTYIHTLGRYLFLPASNYCVAIGGKWTGTAASSPIASRPKYISNISGINTKYLNASVSIPSGSTQGYSFTISHGLWDSPYEIKITPFNISSGTTFSSGNLVLKSITSTQLSIMYTGAPALTASVPLIIEAKAESRLD